MALENDYYSNLEILFIIKDCHSEMELIKAALAIGFLIGEGCKINDTAFKKYSKRRLSQLNANSSRKKR